MEGGNPREEEEEEEEEEASVREKREGEIVDDIVVHERGTE
jgi:hypothetical protein